MPRTENSKLKLLYLAKIFADKTDDQHALTLREIEDELGKDGIHAERKTLYRDIEELKRFGMDIIDERKGRSVVYKLVNRNFELAELKLLVDCVQSSKFITERKSKKLIKKLESLVSKYEAKELQRQVILAGRVKNINETIYYSVDKIHTAINSDRQITFQYFQWNEKKEQVLRHGGAVYHVSPWALAWDDEYYYLIGYDAAESKIKHYRVDKMLKLEVSEDIRQGKEIYSKMDLPSYSKSLFGMFGGEPADVTLLCENDMAAPLIDRFGKDIRIVPAGDGHFQAHVKVSSSNQFLGWIIALGEGVKIVAPESMVKSIREEARRLGKMYLSEEKP